MIKTTSSPISLNTDDVSGAFIILGMTPEHAQTIRKMKPANNLIVLVWFIIQKY